MGATTVFESASLGVVDFRCSAGPGDAPFPELHGTSCLAFVRRGSFGYRVRGAAHELVAGSVLVGDVGDEFVCSHTHHAGGDECLSLHFVPEVAEEVGGGRGVFGVGSVPPRAELVVMGALAEAAAERRSGLAADEAALLFASRFAELASGKAKAKVKPSARAARLAIEAALYVDAYASEPIGLDALAAEAGFSSFHFLRLFSSVVGASPHQYLLRARLLHAARLLAEEDRPITEIAYDVGFGDLSNFVRTFHRAAGMSPRAFRRASRGDRKIFHERLGALATRWKAKGRS
jgi:AraC-like DNA-binding protein